MGGRPRSPRDPILAARLRRERARNTSRIRDSAAAILERLDTIAGPGSAAERAELEGELRAISRDLDRTGVTAAGTALLPSGEGFVRGIQEGTPTRVGGSRTFAGRTPGRSRDTDDAVGVIFGPPGGRRSAVAGQGEQIVSRTGSTGTIDLLSRRRRAGRRGRSGRPDQITAPSLGSGATVGATTALGIL